MVWIGRGQVPLWRSDEQVVLFVRRRRGDMVRSPTRGRSRFARGEVRSSGGQAREWRLQLRNSTAQFENDDGSRSTCASCTGTMEGAPPGCPGHASSRERQYEETPLGAGWEMLIRAPGSRGEAARTQPPGLVGAWLPPCKRALLHGPVLLRNSTIWCCCSPRPPAPPRVAVAPANRAERSCTVCPVALRHAGGLRRASSSRREVRKAAARDRDISGEGLVCLVEDNP